LVKKKQVSFTKALSYWVVGILILGLIILIPAELVTRLLQDKSPYYKSAFIDNHYGWKTKANYKEQKKIDVIHGESYTVDYNTGHEGFRPYGDPNSSLPKLLVIGDSYTQAVEANNGRAYADVLADSLGLELFTYGQAGYGTYQQYLILHAYIDAIRPQILLLQVCDNDFIDNYTPLEYTSNYKVGEKRPYLQQDGTTTFERPVPKWQRIIDKSAFLEILRKKFQTTFAEVNLVNII